MCTCVSVCVDMHSCLNLKACEHFCLFHQSDNCVLPAMYKEEAS